MHEDSETCHIFGVKLSSDSRVHEDLQSRKDPVTIKRMYKLIALHFLLLSAPYLKDKFMINMFFGKVDVEFG